MSTAVQLLRLMTSQAEAGAVPPAQIDLSACSADLVFFCPKHHQEGSWLPYVEAFALTQEKARFTPATEKHGAFTVESWRGRTEDGVYVYLRVHRDGDTRSDAEILTTAAEHVRNYGLAQRDFTDGTGACCVSGAIQYAVCGDANNVKVGQSAKKVFAESLGLVDAEDADGVTVEDLIGRWNDEDGRTADQVVLALLQVADQEQTAEKHPAVAR